MIVDYVLVSIEVSVPNKCRILLRSILQREKKLSLKVLSSSVQNDIYMYVVWEVFPQKLF